MNDIVTYLQGKKTYILGTLAIIVIVLAHFGIVSATAADTILPLLGFGGLLTLRAALN